MKNSERKAKKAVESPEDVPRFSTDEEAAAFWQTHELGAGMLALMQPPPEGALPEPRSRTTPISLRMDSEMLCEIKSLAFAQSTPYQTLLKEVLATGLAVVNAERPRALSSTTAEYMVVHVEAPSDVSRRAQAVRSRRHVFEFAA